MTTKPTDPGFRTIYQIVVSYNEVLFFKTDFFRDKDKADKVYAVLKQKFPEFEGYRVSISI